MPATPPPPRPAPAAGPGATEKFPPIAGYGFLSDCHTSALLSYAGTVEWLCIPRFASPSVFGAMLDRDAGHFSLRPKGVIVPISRRYIPGTLVIETTWVTDTGWLLVHDALSIAAWTPSEGTPIVSHQSDQSLLRTVTCIDGEVEIEMECRPRFDYGRSEARWEEPGGGAAIAVGPEGTEGRSAPEAQERLALTDDFWRLWLRHGEFPDHPWRIHLQRSALVLKGLTYNPTGAIIAAPTTSLPETPGGERNWDYRYSWIRDSTFSLWALHTLGFDQEARDFMRFILTVCRDHPELQIMYGIGHERELTETTLDHLSGYEGARPVRIGNEAYEQRQNDVWGALIDSVYLHEKALAGSGSEADPQTVRPPGEQAIRGLPLPDQGIWESRGAPQHYVSSKVSMWVAADRGARMAREAGNDDLAAQWQGGGGQLQGARRWCRRAARG